MTQLRNIKTQRPAMTAEEIPENVGENWVLHDTVLIGQGIDALTYKTGWQNTYAALGAQQDIPFFNTRNRNHGLPYNNQDTIGTMSYGFRIYTIGVRFFAPSCSQFSQSDTEPSGEQNLPSVLWSNELVKHCGLVLTTNQDERLRISCLMVPPGVGVSGGGVSQGDMEGGYSVFNAMTMTNGQGVPMLTNKWGFAEPLDIPRRAALSVRITVNEYGKEMLKWMRGPFFHPVRNWAGDGSWSYIGARAGLQVFLGGQRLVQQRGQYHA